MMNIQHLEFTRRDNYIPHPAPAKTTEDKASIMSATGNFFTVCGAEIQNHANELIN
jgi:hypothetical protein